jgi:hypothetical protein
MCVHLVLGYDQDNDFSIIPFRRRIQHTYLCVCVCVCVCVIFLGTLAQKERVQMMQHKTTSIKYHTIVLRPTHDAHTLTGHDARARAHTHTHTNTQTCKKRDWRVQKFMQLRR